MKDVNDLLPTVSAYRDFLDLASFKFRITINEARKKFGLFTVRQWKELLEDK